MVPANKQPATATPQTTVPLWEQLFLLVAGQWCMIRTKMYRMAKRGRLFPKRDYWKMMREEMSHPWTQCSHHVLKDDGNSSGSWTGCMRCKARTHYRERNAAGLQKYRTACDASSSWRKYTHV